MKAIMVTDQAAGTAEMALVERTEQEIQNRVNVKAYLNHAIVP